MICETLEDFEGMRMAGKVVKDALLYAETLIKPGISTYELDKMLEKFIINNNAIPSFLGYNGYPASICASVNHVVVHGIPSKKVILQDGDIISVDIGAILNGYNGDAARTFAVGKITEDKQRLIDVTKQCFFEGIAKLHVDCRIGEISNRIQEYAESHGYSVVRELVGHGIGHKMHEEPAVPNFGLKTHGARVKNGMCLAIEPMINQGAKEVRQNSDGWTIETLDKLPSAHYENTVIVTENGVEITTL